MAVGAAAELAELDEGATPALEEVRVAELGVEVAGVEGAAALLDEGEAAGLDELKAAVDEREAVGVDEEIAAVEEAEVDADAELTSTGLAPGWLIQFKLDARMLKTGRPGPNLRKHLFKTSK